MQGYIKLHRQIQLNPVWVSDKFSRGQAWIDLLLLANHTETHYYKRGNKVIVKRGQVAWSMKKLAARWRWSIGKVNRFLNDLKTVGQIDSQKNNVTTLITIINYDRYQGDDTANSTADGTQTERRRKHNNNDKNDKNDNSNNKKHFFNDNPFEDK